MQNRDHSLAPYAALLAVQLLFGSLPVIGKVVLAVLPSFALVGFRVGITAASSSPSRLSESGYGCEPFRLLAARGSQHLRGYRKPTAVHFGPFPDVASNTSLLAVTIPIFALSAGALAKTERLGKFKLCGIVLAAIGVILLIDPRKASFSSSTTLGDLLIVVNSLSYGIYVAVSKDVVTRNGAFRSITWIFIFASVICIPLGGYSLTQIDAGSVPAAIWLLVVYIALMATAAPYIFNAWALARVSPSTVAVFVYLQPVIGFILAVVFLGERVGINFLIAGLMIFAGLYLATRANADPTIDRSPKCS